MNRLDFSIEIFVMRAQSIDSSICPVVLIADGLIRTPAIIRVAQSRHQAKAPASENSPNVALFRVSCQMAVANDAKAIAPNSDAVIGRDARCAGSVV